MGLFGKSKPSAVRHDTVMKLINLGMKETDAADRDTDSAQFADAKGAFEAELSKASPAERSAAFDALRRHGY